MEEVYLGIRHFAVFRDLFVLLIFREDVLYQYTCVFFWFLLDFMKWLYFVLAKSDCFFFTSVLIIWLNVSHF